MTRRAPSSAVHASIARVALIAFALRALIPAGFMPSAEHPFTLSICPDGFPIGLLPAHADHSARHVHAGHHLPGSVPTDDTGSTPHDHIPHCPFAGAAAAPQLADLAIFTISMAGEQLADLPYLSPSLGTHRFLLAQPRAPPALA